MPLRHPVSPSETFEPARLSRAEQTLNRQMESFYASYLQRDPWFPDANLRALSGRTCPRPDRPPALVDRLTASPQPICASVRFSARRSRPWSTASPLPRRWLNSLVFNLTRFIGPALARIVIAEIGIA